MDIKVIDPTTVHQICSGQVVLTLAVAVKELVENAVDAGATNVEIRLRDYGSKLVEVSDNGHGVQEKNFSGLTLKHHTSKIRKFEDLECGVNTFGFRGEALSSLCALSRLSVTTRHEGAQVATNITYDHQGHITETTLRARQVGTTVSLENLFSTLPVRHKEFHRNLKKEFHKMVALLNAYCVISTGVRISCYNSTGDDGKRSLVLSTNGSMNLLENISSVYGSKQLTTLKKFVQEVPSTDYLEEFGCKTHVDEQTFTITGYVSSCEHGCGRGSIDRQHYYINGRPCDIDKLSRLVNEVYHSYNKHQYPCVFLNIQVEKGAVDVNVTPDKRKVFLDYEPYLLAVIKSSLNTLWEPEALTYSQQNVPQVVTTQQTAFSVGDPENKSCMKPTLSGIYSKLRQEESAKNRNSLDYYMLPKDKKRAHVDLLPHPESQSNSTISSNDKLTENSDSVGLHSKWKTGRYQPATQEGSQRTYHAMEESSPPTDDNITSCASGHNTQVTMPTTPVHRDPPIEPSSQPAGTTNTTTSLETSCDALKPTIDSEDDKHILIDEPNVRSRKESTVAFSLSALRKRYNTHLSSDTVNPIDCPKFRAKISPDQNTDAENELKKAISKSDFNHMEVLGQFNHGFIIGRLHHDLFIIDQHATDEKYNFEMLQRHTVIKRQALLIPKPLGLSSTNEILLMDNLEIFHKNGFEFAIDESADPTMRVSLKTQPVSKNWTFGKDDIDEILYMLRECPERSFRPSRVRAMFASRACRKSVMIGKPLSKQEMMRLIQHMGEIEQPWNCPHGRPTMRHLVNLDLLIDG